jgi:uncharacterized protein
MCARHPSPPRRPHHRMAGRGYPRVFGSVLNGSDAEGSDLDLLVDALPGATLFDLGGLQCELEDLLGVAVDVLTPDDLPQRFRATVLPTATSRSISTWFGIPSKLPYQRYSGIYRISKKTAERRSSASDCILMRRVPSAKPPSCLSGSCPAVGSDLLNSLRSTGQKSALAGRQFITRMPA